ncbi:MAG TPA: hypothetical protein VFF43_19090 [Caldimonas sp.]|nr:hypothetical protein [Caldimonas sp.]
MLERFAALDRRQDVVGRRIDDAAKAEDARRRQRLAHDAENRNAVHDGPLEEERHTRRVSFAREVAVRERRRAFVRCDDVRTSREAGAHVRDCRLARPDVEGRRLNEYAGLDALYAKLRDPLQRRRLGRQPKCVAFGERPRSSAGVETRRIEHAAVPLRRDANDPRLDAEPPQRILRLVEQRHEASRHVPKSHEHQIDRHRR